MTDLNGASSMKTGAEHWYPEDRLERLDRCRRFLFGQGVITKTVNDAISASLEEAIDLYLEAEKAPYVLVGVPTEEELEADE